ncbi:MAG: hypothetical protein ABH842_04630 [Candidatus Micrarchaeota archaeon]
MDYLSEIKKNTLKIVQAGIILILLAGFLVNDSIDQTKTAILMNIDDLDGDLQEAEASLLIVNNEIDSANATFYKFKDAFEKVGHAAGLAANGTEGVTNAISKMGIFGQVIQLQMGNMRQSIDLIREAMVEMEEGVSEMEEQTGEIEKLKSSVNRLYNQVVSQRGSLSETRRIVDESFFKLKIANFFFVLAGSGMFAILLSISTKK